jgi:WD40 repeat protein
MTNALSEYERRRQENIQRNQELLASLQLPKLQLSSPQVPKRQGLSSTVIKRTRQPQEPSRKSVRLMEKSSGVRSTLAEEETAHIQQMEPKPLKPPRIVNKVPFEPIVGATEDFERMMQACCLLSVSSPMQAGLDLVEEMAKTMDFRHRHCQVKVASDRIYSMTFYPTADKVLPIVGTKFGHLALWDATELCQADYAPPTDVNLDKDFRPRVFNFQPHREESVSNVRVVDGSIFTTSYDGTMKRMDLQRGEFEPCFVSPDDDRWVICGADAVTATQWLVSDVLGRLGCLDLRTPDKLVAVHALKDKKLGCVSQSRLQAHVVCTACNDGSVDVWDMRGRLDQSVRTWRFSRAVTSAYLHPRRTDVLLATSYDDHIRIITFGDDRQSSGLEKGSGGIVEMKHNNQTGRWITPFKAQWDVKSPPDLRQSVVVCGNMNRGLDLFQGQTGALLQTILSPHVTSQPAVPASHPLLPIIGAGNASGKIVLYTSSISEA